MFKGGLEYEETKYAVVVSLYCVAALRLFGRGMQTLEATHALHHYFNDIDTCYDNHAGYDYDPCNNYDIRNDNDIDNNYYYDN